MTAGDLNSNTQKSARGSNDVEPLKVLASATKLPWSDRTLKNFLGPKKILAVLSEKLNPRKSSSLPMKQKRCSIQMTQDQGKILEFEVG